MCSNSNSVGPEGATETYVACDREKDYYCGLIPTPLKILRDVTGVTYIVKPLLYRYEGRETDHDAGEEVRSQLTTMWNILAIVSALVVAFAFDAYRNPLEAPDGVPERDWKLSVYNISVFLTLSLMWTCVLISSVMLGFFALLPSHAVIAAVRMGRFFIMTPAILTSTGCTTFVAGWAFYGEVAYANDEAQLWVVRVFTGSIFFLFVVIMIVSVVFQSTLTHLLSTSKGTQVISFLPRKSREILLAAQAEKEEKTGFDETALN